MDSTHYGTTGYANGQIRVAFIRGNEYLDNKESAQISGNRLTGGIVIATGEYHRNSWLKVSTHFVWWCTVMQFTVVLFFEVFLLAYSRV